MICTTTLNKLRANSPCEPGWKKLLSHLGKTTAKDEPVTLQTILESNGIDDALWCLRASDATEFDVRRFARLAALDVAHLWDMPAIVRKYLETGDETKRNAALAAAQDAAWAAAQDATQAAAQDAARAASWAAQDDAVWAAQDAAWAAAGDAAQDATQAAAQDAARAASWAAQDDAVWAASWAVRNASWAAQEARKIQTERFISMFCTESKP